MLARLLSLTLLFACAGGEEPVDCTTALASFRACDVGDGADGICLEGACTPLVPRGSTPWGSGPTFPLPDSALRECQGPDGPIPCPGDAGSASCADTVGCGQDAQYGWDAVYPRSERFEISAEGELVVEDVITGLEWMGCAKGQAGSICSGEATRGPWDEAVSFCQDSTWGGHDDWQLPSASALQTITDYSTTSPAIDTVFQNAPSRVTAENQEWWKECSWSATEYANDGNVVWASMTNSGDVLAGSGVPYHPHDKQAADWEGCYTRCVRAHPVPAHERFIAFDGGGEPFVADTVGQRFWAGCSVGQTGPDCAGEATRHAWPDALAACEALDWGGHDDWRLPNIVELRSLVDLGQFRPAIDPTLFPNTPYYTGGDDNLEGQFWTSTARWYNSFALYVSFHDGGNHFYVQDEERHVRCVRGGS